MKYFKLEEFQCLCGCGYNPISTELIKKLDKARAIAEVPFVITSGSRCPKHNTNVGGSPYSSHVKGLAVDIKVKDSRTRHQVLTALHQVGFERVGISKDFIHCDIDSAKDQKVCWVY